MRDRIHDYLLVAMVFAEFCRFVREVKAARRERSEAVAAKPESRLVGQPFGQRHGWATAFTVAVAAVPVLYYLEHTVS